MWVEYLLWIPHSTSQWSRFNFWTHHLLDAWTNCRKFRTLQDQHRLFLTANWHWSFNFIFIYGVYLKSLDQMWLWAIKTDMGSNVVLAPTDARPVLSGMIDPYFQHNYRSLVMMHFFVILIIYYVRFSNHRENFWKFRLYRNQNLRSVFISLKHW